MNQLPSYHSAQQALTGSFKTVKPLSGGRVLSSARDMPVLCLWIFHIECLAYFSWRRRTSCLSCRFYLELLPLCRWSAVHPAPAQLPPAGGWMAAWLVRGLVGAPAVLEVSDVAY